MGFLDLWFDFLKVPLQIVPNYFLPICQFGTAGIRFRIRSWRLLPHIILLRIFVWYNQQEKSHFLSIRHSVSLSHNEPSSRLHIVRIETNIWWETGPFCAIPHHAGKSYLTWLMSTRMKKCWQNKLNHARMRKSAYTWSRSRCGPKQMDHFSLMFLAFVDGEWAKGDPVYARTTSVWHESGSQSLIYSSFGSREGTTIRQPWESFWNLVDWTECFCLIHWAVRLHNVLSDSNTKVDDACGPIRSRVHLRSSRKHSQRNTTNTKL